MQSQLLCALAAYARARHDTAATAAIARAALAAAIGQATGRPDCQILRDLEMAGV